MNAVSNNHSCMAGLANLGVATAFGAIMVSMEQTCGAFIIEGQRQRIDITKALKEGTEVPELEIDDNQMALLQAGRSFALVCLFGIFFMVTASPLVSKKRIFPMRSFTFLLAFLSFLAFSLQIYLIRSIKKGITRGDRTMRISLAIIYMIFMAVSLFVMFNY
jgi:formate hydrogenlyase subunit 4